MSILASCLAIVVSSVTVLFFLIGMLYFGITFPSSYLYSGLLLFVLGYCFEYFWHSSSWKLAIFASSGMWLYFSYIVGSSWAKGNTEWIAVVEGVAAVGAAYLGVLLGRKGLSTD